MERRLAAILAADVVGYSRLMGADEAATLAALNAHRKELVDAKIAEQHNERDDPGASQSEPHLRQDNAPHGAQPPCAADRGGLFV